MSPPALIVSVDIDGQTVDAGTAYFTLRRSALTTTFQYLPSYLADRRAYPIDPALDLLEGQHATAGLPGAFADCAPDRWGRNLIARRLRAQALAEGRAAPQASPVDYLLGVADLTRQGALRFRLPGTTTFLDPDQEVPKLVELPRLLRASDLVDGDPQAEPAAVKALLGAGTGTLGGARPKASVRDASTLRIAKFPKAGDQWDVMRWEKTALDLAEQAGLRVPRRELITMDGRGVLLVERFDRRFGRRVGYLSAMTMTHVVDGAQGDYVDLAEAFAEHACDVNSGLTELFRRIAFFIAVNNTDDHLRNHGFLRARNGWELSPLFDVNPNPDQGVARATSIGGAAQGEEQLRALDASAPSFGLDPGRAGEIVAQVIDAVGGWRRAAAANGLSPAQIRRMAPAFRLGELGSTE